MWIDSVGLLLLVLLVILRHKAPQVVTQQLQLTTGDSYNAHTKSVHNTKCQASQNIIISVLFQHGTKVQYLTQPLRFYCDPSLAHLAV